MEILKIRPKTYKKEIRIFSSKPNEKMRIASSNILNNINKIRPKSKNAISTYKFDLENEKIKSSNNNFSYVKIKEVKGNLQEVKKNTLKLLQESKVSPFEKLNEYDKYKLRLKSSEGMKKILNLGIYANNDDDNNYLKENINIDSNNNNLKIKKSSKDIKRKEVLNSKNNTLKPFELEKENLDLLLFNEKNRIEFYQGSRKAKTSQIKFREKIPLHEKIKKELDKKTDILSLFDNLNQKEIPLKKTNLTTLSFKINNKIKAIRNNKNLINEQKVIKNIKGISNFEYFNEYPFFNQIKNTYGENKDTDLIEVNADYFINSNENYIDKNKNNPKQNLNSESLNKSQANKNKNKENVKYYEIKTTNENNELKSYKRDIYDELNNYLKLSCGLTPSKKFDKEKKNLIKLLDAKKLNHSLDMECSEEINDFMESERSIDEKYAKMVRDTLDEIVLENFFNYGKYENLKGHKRINNFFDDEYKVPNLNNKLVFFQRLDTSSEKLDDNFIKEKIMSPNSLKNKVLEKLNEKRIFFKNVENHCIDDLPYMENDKSKKNDMSIISATNDPEKKFQKFKLSNFNMIGYLKNKFDNYEKIKFADEKIISNFNNHIKDSVKAKRKKLITLSN